MRKLTFCLLSIAFSLIALGVLGATTRAGALAEPNAPATTYTIDTCTLANFNTALTSANDGDVIHVRCNSQPAAVSITFTDVKILNKSITIIGSHPISGLNRLSGNDVTELFSVSVGQALTLTNIIIEHGYNNLSSGGCLRVFGALIALTTTVRYCETSSIIGTPAGGGIYASAATVRLINTTLYSNTADGDGGGLYALNSTVSITRSRIEDNRANVNGGGVGQSGGSARFDTTTIISNSARFRGGGLYTTKVLTLSVLNASRLELNRTTDLTTSLGGGGYFTESRPYLANVYIGGNIAKTSGGGLYVSDSSFALYSSVITANTSSDGVGGVDFSDGSGSIYQNLFQGNGGYVNGGALYNAGTLNTGSNQFIRNNGYYGGGIYNAATGLLDIYDTTFDHNTGAYGAGLRNEGRINYGIGLTFTGNVAVWNGGGLYSSGASSGAALTNVLFFNNQALNGDGGGLYVSGNVTVSLSQASVVSNGVKHDGAGLWAKNATIKLSHAAVTDNKVDGTDDYSSGGGIYITGTTSRLTLNDGQVLRNRIDDAGYGGGIHAFGTTSTLKDVDISDNLSNGATSGGGLYIEKGSAILDTATINRNLNTYSGGGLTALNTTLTLLNVSLQANKVSAYGGGLLIYSATVTLDNVTVSDHSGASSGGGLYCYKCKGTWQNLGLSRNSSDVGGGGLFASSSTVTLQNATLDGNEANDGGGLYNQESTLQLINVTLSGNQAANTGGGIHNHQASIGSSVLTLTNVTLKDNGALDGGGLYSVNDPETHTFLKNTVIADSTSGGNCKGKAFDSSKYSLSSDNTCALSGTGDQNSVAAKLNPLGLVGGSLKTHLPLPDSPLIDLISGSDYPSTDQRGIGRPQGLGGDTGAVERQASDPVYSLLSYLPLVLK